MEMSFQLFALEFKLFLPQKYVPELAVANNLRDPLIKLLSFSTMKDTNAWKPFVHNSLQSIELVIYFSDYFKKGSESWKRNGVSKESSKFFSLDHGFEEHIIVENKLR